MRFSRIVIFVIVTTVVVVLSASAGTFWREKLTASDGAVDEQFGKPVCISGNVCIVGARTDDDNGQDSGSAYIFRFDGCRWIQEDKLLASDGAYNDGFGRSVSVSNGVCLVGASGDDDDGSCSGSAYIFRFNGTRWEQEEKLVAPDAEALDFFGYSVCIDGNACIIGAHLDDTYGMASGSAYIFRFDDNANAWIFEEKLIASDGAVMDNFGTSVSINGNVSIVGAPMDDDNGGATGSAYIFRFNGVQWVQEAKLTASDGDAEDYFGCSVSIDDNLCVAGAHGNDANGSAYVFRLEDSNWVQTNKLTASDGAVGDNFGASVSVYEDVLIVGAVADDDNGTESGSAYIFQFRQPKWIQTEKIVAFDGATFDLFGESVSVNNGNIIVGAASKDYLKGAAYTFRPCPTADLSGDCFVNFADIAIIAQQWLTGENLN